MAKNSVAGFPGPGIDLCTVIGNDASTLRSRYRIAVHMLVSDRCMHPHRDRRGGCSFESVSSAGMSTSFPFVQLLPRLGCHLATLFRVKVKRADASFTETSTAAVSESVSCIGLSSTQVSVAHAFRLQVVVGSPLTQFMSIFSNTVDHRLILFCKKICT